MGGWHSSALVTNHLVEVTWSIISATRMYRRYGWMAVALWGHQSWNLLEVVTLWKSKPYLKSRATLDELRRPVQCRNIFINDLHDIANDTMAPLVVENVAYHKNNNVHRMNNIEWTDEQRHRIVVIDTEERKRGNTSWRDWKKDGTLNFQQLRKQHKT